VALKIAEKWNVTGNTGPNAVSSDGLGEWLVTGGRRLEGLFTLAVLQTPKTQVVDLGALLLSGISEYQTRGDSFVSVCMDDSCGCSGQAHP
jgi:hypothetical protein